MGLRNLFGSRRRAFPPVEERELQFHVKRERFDLLSRLLVMHAEKKIIIRFPHVETLLDVVQSKVWFLDGDCRMVIRLTPGLNVEAFWAIVKPHITAFGGVPKFV